jgi:prepilin signal peptidase PulO-like enzyme (type II secretory pathway)
MEGTTLCILISSLSGSIIGGAALMINKKGIRARIPFGPFLALVQFSKFFLAKR